MDLYYLAERLHKTVQEISQMSIEEFIGWRAFTKIKHEKNSKK